MASILQNIPESEWDAIRLGYSDYDCTEAIRRALADYRSVEVPAGRYLIRRRGSEGVILEMQPGSRIVGEGPASIIQMDAGVNDSNFWRALGVCDKDAGVIYEDITVADLTIDGGSTLPAYDPEHEQNHGLFFYSYGLIRNITIRDVVARNCSGDGFCISTGTRDATLARCRAEGNRRQGINISGSGGHQLVACRADGGGLHCEPAALVDGLAVSGGVFSVVSVGGHGPDAPLTRCKITDATVAGIIKGNYLSGLQVAGCSAERVEFSRIVDARIAGCTVRPAPDHYGICVVQVGGMGARVTVDGNTVVASPDAVRAGIYVNQIDGSVIAGNSASGSHGAIVQGGSDHIVTGNRLMGSSYGLVISASERMPIAGCLMISGNALSGASEDLRVAGAPQWCTPTVGTNALAHGVPR